VRFNIREAKASRPGDGFIPNPKLKLLDQVSEVMRFKHYSIRTETTYREWIKRYIFFHDPCDAETGPGGEKSLGRLGDPLKLQPAVQRGSLEWICAGRRKRAGCVMFKAAAAWCLAGWPKRES
jgi:Phage integrase, N-terminal SAM-like domain